MWVPFIWHTTGTLGGPHFPSLSPLPLRLSHLQLSASLEGQGAWQGMMMFSSGFWECFPSLLYASSSLDICTKMHPGRSVTAFHHRKWSALVWEEPSEWRCCVLNALADRLSTALNEITVQAHANETRKQPRSIVINIHMYISFQDFISIFLQSLLTMSGLFNLYFCSAFGANPTDKIHLSLSHKSWHFFYLNSIVKWVAEFTLLVSSSSS